MHLSTTTQHTDLLQFIGMTNVETEAATTVNRGCHDGILEAATTVREAATTVFARLPRR